MIFVSLIVLSLSFLCYTTLSCRDEANSSLLRAGNQEQKLQSETSPSNANEDIRCHLQTIESKIVELQKSLEYKDNSLLTVSHECRNPLSGIQSNLELAETVLLDESALEEIQVEKIRGFIHNAKVCGEVLLHYINNILDAARVESNGIDIHPTPVDIRSVLEKAWAVCSESIRKKNLVGNLILDKRVPFYLNIDSHRLIQVLINLINNSIKFTKKGAITIKVTWKEDDDCAGSMSPETRTPKVIRRASRTLTVILPKATKQSDGQFSNVSSSNEPVTSQDTFASRCKTYNHAMLLQRQQSKLYLDFEQQQFKPMELDRRVSSRFEDREGTLVITIMDTGCGISEENIPKLFQKFSQVNNDPSKRKIGTGLGLWLCKHICEGMGGSIDVHSQVDFGSSFVVNIPTVTCENKRFISLKSLPLVPSEYPSSPELTPSFRKLRAIVLGSDDYARKVHSTFLEKCNCEIICQSNNQMTAYDCFKRLAGNVEIVLVDQDAADNGICKTIRDYEGRYKLPRSLILVVGIDSNRIRRTSIREDSPERQHFDRFIKAPCSLNDIRAAVEEAISKKSFSNAASPVIKREPIKQNKKVLVIDDDGFCLEVARNFFEGAKIETFLASSSDQGFEILKRSSDEIGCIMIDYEMPEMNGKELMLLIKEYWNYMDFRGVPIYCCSGNTEKEFKENMKQSGFTEVYAKPLNWRKVLADVKMVLAD